jgi:hypothetical protein
MIEKYTYKVMCSRDIIFFVIINIDKVQTNILFTFSKLPSWIREHAHRYIREREIDGQIMIQVKSRPRILDF